MTADAMTRTQRQAEFLTAADVPANGPTLRKGDIVRFVVARQVYRIGYRLGLGDAPAMGEQALSLVHDLAKLAGRKSGYPDTRMVTRWWRVEWLRAQHFGGPDRGVQVGPVEECGCALFDIDIATDLQVTGKRNRVVGTYYPASGRWEDHEPAELMGRQTVVVVELQCCGCFETWSAMAGDLKKVVKEAS